MSSGQGGWGTPPPTPGGPGPGWQPGTPPAAAPAPLAWGVPQPPGVFPVSNPVSPPPPVQARPPRRRGRRATGIALVLLLVAGAAAALRVLRPDGTSRPSDASTPAVVTAPQGAVATALAGLRVADEADAANYDRSAFGPAWTDTDHNGCDTRNDVLRRDLTDVALKPGTNGCAVLSGTLIDPYSGVTVFFSRGTPGIQIDHVVSLADAWRTGASTWPYAKLLALANDPLELLAVEGSLNQAKGDSDAATWLPPAHVCAYVARQIAVKQKYELTVEPREHDALAAANAQCPEQRLPAGGTPTVASNRPPPSTAPSPPESTGSTAAQGSVEAGTPSDAAVAPNYGTCREAKAHGAGPYYAGRDPEYSYYQDRDKDGIVCE